MEHRRLATVLFTDIVGSTERAAELGDRRWRQVLDAHDDITDRLVATFGGRVVHRAGDGMLAIFDMPGRAIQCASAIVDEVRSIDVEVRAGAHTGEIDLRGDDVGGIGVHIAARVASKASANEVLVSSAIPPLVAGSDIEFEDRGEHELKGVPGRWQLLLATCAHAAPASDTVVGPTRTKLPAALAEQGPYVGRARELSLLDAAFSAARGGERQVVFIAGEPGIGKTRLASHACVAMHEQGAAVLFGRCDEDAGMPHQPFVEAIRTYVAEVSGAELRAHLGRRAGELARLVPDISERLRGLPPPTRADPESERYLLFDAVTTLLRGIASGAPLVVVLDDLHWADKPTLLLLRHVLRELPQAGLLLLATYRETELGRTHPLSETLGELRRERLGRRLSLAGLDEAEVTQLVQASGAPSDVARSVWAETEGNPFFVQEVIRHFEESGATRGIPEGVKEVVGRRLSRLSEDANRALSVAAVAGLQFDLAVVEGASGLDTDKTLDVLEEATAAQLIREMSGDRFAFCHALIRETLVEELSTSRRVRMHARIAEILEKTGGSLSELAYQYGEAAGANTAAKAVDYAMRAAEQAMESLAFEEAVRLCESVRHLTEEDDAARCGLLLLLARAQSKMGEPGSSKSSAVEAAAVARRLGDFGSLARAALIAGSWPESPHLPWTEDLMAEALSALPPDDSVERAQVLARLATMRARSDIDAGRDLEQQALAMADRLDDPPTTAFVTRAAIAALWDPLQPEQRMAWAERLGELGEQLADKELQLMSQSWFTHFALETGDRDAFDRCCARFEVEAQDLPVSGSWFEIVRSLLSLIEGRFEETSDRLRRIDELGQQPGWEMMGGFATIQRITLLWLRGRVGEMAAALTPPFDTWARSEAGEPIDAAWVDEALQLRTNKGWGTMWESVVTAIGGVAVRHGSDDACRQVYEILAPLEGRHYVVPTALTTYGPHARLLGALAGRLGMWAEAERLFELCLKSCVELRSPPLVAQAQCEYAEMLSAKGDHERAHALMREALATAGRLGMAEVKRRAGQLLD